VFFPEAHEKYPAQMCRNVHIIAHVYAYVACMHVCNNTNFGQISLHIFNNEKRKDTGMNYNSYSSKKTFLRAN